MIASQLSKLGQSFHNKSLSNDFLESISKVAADQYWVDAMELPVQHQKFCKYHLASKHVNDNM